MFLGFSQVVQWLRICLAMQRIRVWSLIGELRSNMIGFPHGSNDKESASNVGDPGLIPGSGRFPGKGNGLPLQYSWSSQVVQLVKNPSASARDIRDVGSISELGRSPGGENGNPLQYSWLENFMDRGTWRATVQGSQRVRHNWSDLTHTLVCSKSNDIH